jgi:hypothetical protein
MLQYLEGMVWYYIRNVSVQQEIKLRLFVAVTVDLLCKRRGREVSWNVPRVWKVQKTSNFGL